ncbi:MAG: ECF-type sigma factor [Bryobacteraceae bacterium]
MNPGLDTVGELMARFRKGDKSAAGALVEVFFPELRRMAAARMQRERTQHTWQPTALVNEVYLELVKIKALSGAGAEAAQERAMFLGLAGHLMKRLLIHHARPLYRQAQHTGFEDVDLQSDSGQALTEVETMLADLEKIDPKLRSVVELKVFEGCSIDEAAERMQCSRRSVSRYWHFASKWLEDNLVPTGPAPPPSQPSA